MNLQSPEPFKHQPWYTHCNLSHWSILPSDKRANLWGHVSSNTLQAFSFLSHQTTTSSPNTLKNKVGIGLKWEICNRGFTSCWALWLWSEGWNEEAICASTFACFRIKIQSYCGWQKNLKRIIKLGIEYVSWKWIIQKL